MSANAVDSERNARGCYKCAPKSWMAISIEYSEVGIRSFDLSALPPATLAGLEYLHLKRRAADLPAKSTADSPRMRKGMPIFIYDSYSSRCSGSSTPRSCFKSYPLYDIRESQDHWFLRSTEMVTKGERHPLYFIFKSWWSMTSRRI